MIVIYLGIHYTFTQQVHLCYLTYTSNYTYRSKTNHNTKKSLIECAFNVQYSFRRAINLEIGDGSTSHKFCIIDTIKWECSLSVQYENLAVRP